MIAAAHPVLPARWSSFVDPILGAIEAKHSPIALLGLGGAAKGLVLSALAISLPDRHRSMVILAATEESAEDLCADLLFFHKLFGASADRILFFPEWGQLPYASGPPPAEVIGTRMKVLDQLSTVHGSVLVTSVPAFLQ